MAQTLLIIGPAGAIENPANSLAEREVLRVPLIKNRYGKGRVRVMRIHRDGERHEVSQLNIKAMVEGDFARTYTHADNTRTVSTDTIKNVVNIVARENTGLCTSIRR
jgi:urate oxidase